MHKELRYQVKTHTISGMPRKKYTANSPNFFILFYFYKNIMQYGNDIMQGTIKPDDANTEKQSLDLLFLSSPTSTCKVLSREIWGKNTTGS
jgi:hypothetical protein